MLDLDFGGDGDADGMQTVPTAADGIGEAGEGPSLAEAEAQAQAAAEADGRIPMPARKDVSLREFLSKMDEYAPIVSIPFLSDSGKVLFSVIRLPSLPFIQTLSTLYQSKPSTNSTIQKKPPSITNLQLSPPPQIPDAVTAHHLTLAGLPPPHLSSLSQPATSPAPITPNTTPLHLSRLLALATQKFIADIAADAYQYSRMRSGNVTSNSLTAGANAALGGVAPGAAAAAAAVVVAPGGTTLAGANGAGGGVVSGVGAAGGNAAAGGGGAAGGKSSTGQHVLGIQRPGFGGGGQGGGQGRTVLTMEDLGMAVAEYGVNVRRGEFYR